MIVEIAVGGAIVAAATLAWRRLHERRAVQKRSDQAGDTSKSPEKVERTSEKKREAVANAKATTKTPARSGPRGLRVGDVLLYADAELWLAGCFELDEEGLVARVFRAPGNDRAPWVIQLDPDAQKIVLARECGDEIPAGRVPAELPVAGMRLSLERRGHAEVIVEGELEAKPARGEFVRLTGPGGRELLVVDFEGGERIALFGERTGRELFDFLPGGDG